MPWDVHVQGVPQVARRMVWGDVEHLEVREVVLDLRPLVDHEAELSKDLRYGSDRLWDGMERAAGDSAARQRDIHLFGKQTLGLNCGVEFRSPRHQGALDRLAHLVGDGTDTWSVLCRERPNTAQDGCQVSLLAEILDLELLQIQYLGKKGDRKSTRLNSSHAHTS